MLDVDKALDKLGLVSIRHHTNALKADAIGTIRPPGPVPAGGVQPGHGHLDLLRPPDDVASIHKHRRSLLLLPCFIFANFAIQKSFLIGNRLRTEKSRKNFPAPAAATRTRAE